MNQKITRRFACRISERFCGLYSICRDIDRSIPTPIINQNNDDPPQLTNGRVTPVSGTILRFTPIFIVAWISIQIVIPRARYRPKGSFTDRAIRKPRYVIIIYIDIRINAPKNPSSSTITEKIKSHCTSGRQPNFWIDLPNPRPKNPPEPIAISHCFI